MQKRGIADHFNFGQSENDLNGLNESSVDWNLIMTVPNHAPDLTYVQVGSPSEGHIDAIGEDTGAGADAAAAKKGGGSTPSGGGTTSGSGGTTGTGTATGQGTTTTVLHDIPIHWQTLNPPTGNTALPTDTYFGQ